MSDSLPMPALTAEQERALDEHGGILQGPEYVLMRTEAVFHWFGYSSNEELRGLLQPAFDEADGTELPERNLDDFLIRLQSENRNDR